MPSREDVPVCLPDVIRAAGRTMLGFRSYRLSAAARRLEKALAAQGIRTELRHATAARAWVGPEAFDAAVRQAQGGQASPAP